MPTYEYACTDCGQHIEVFQRVSDDPLAECGACGGRLRKVFHPAGIVFKGSGFYATDSRAKPKATASAGEGTAKDAGATGGASTEGATDGAGSGSKGEAGSGSKGEAGSGSRGEAGSDSKGGSSTTAAKEKSA